MANSNLAYKYDNLSRIEDEDARIREQKKAGSTKDKGQRPKTSELFCDLLDNSAFDGGIFYDFKKCAVSGKQ